MRRSKNTCKYCGSPIILIKTDRNHTTPYDVDPSDPKRGTTPHKLSCPNYKGKAVKAVAKSCLSCKWLTTDYILLDCLSSVCVNPKSRDYNVDVSQHHVCNHFEFDTELLAAILEVADT